MKAAALRETWAPWLEGLAVFAELHGDSTNDDAVSPMSLVMLNLEDVPLATTAAETGADPSELYAERQREAERSYADAAREVGPFRLRTYLGKHAAKYLPGYLAVRAVVAAWRRRFSGPLGGSQALRVLMHVTKSGSDEGVPDLGLPLAEFRVAACAHMRAWLQTVANVSSEDLARLLPSYSRPEATDDHLMWRGGHLTHVEPTEREAEAERLYRRRTDQALSTLAGARGSPDRVGDFDDSFHDQLLKGLLETVAESLETRVRKVLVMNFRNINALMLRYRILPIAETTAPFWLNVPTQTLVAIVRTGINGETGNSRYANVAIPLSSDRWEPLLAEAQKTGAARVTITRIAELGELTGEEGKTEGMGANYLVFRLGNWMHVAPAGMLFGQSNPHSDLVSLVRQRLFPNPIARMEGGVTSLAVSCAERTTRWLETVTSWGNDGEKYPLERWALHVYERAMDVMLAQGADPQQGQLCSRALLSFVFGDGPVAAQVAASGLAMGARDQSWIGAAIRLLAETGNAPIPELPREARVIPPQVLETFFERASAGWDFRVPDHAQGGSER